MLKSAFAAFIGSKTQYAELERKQKAERIYFAGKLRTRIHGVTKQIRADHDRDLAALRQRQNLEQQEMRVRHFTQSQQQAREIRAGAARRGLRTFLYGRARRSRRSAHHR